MKICFGCSSQIQHSVLNFDNNKYLCRECIKPKNNKFCSIICGKCKKCNNDITFGHAFSELNMRFKCIECEKQNNINYVKFQNNSIDDKIDEFKLLFPMFIFIKILSDENFDIMMNKILLETNVSIIKSIIFNSLNFPFYFLTTNQTVTLTNYVEDHINYNDGNTYIYHTFFPCVLNITECYAHSDIKGKDRLRYYIYKNKLELYYIWSYCRLSRFNKFNKDDCYVCLEKAHSNQNIKSNIFQPIIDNSIVYCSTCATTSHTECTNMLSKCGICRNLTKKWNEKIIINQEHYLMYIPNHYNITDKLQFDWN